MKQKAAAVAAELYHCAYVYLMGLKPNS